MQLMLFADKGMGGGAQQKATWGALFGQDYLQLAWWPRITSHTTEAQLCSLYRSSNPGRQTMRDRPQLTREAPAAARRTLCRCPRRGGRSAPCGPGTPAAAAGRCRGPSPQRCSTALSHKGEKGNPDQTSLQCPPAPAQPGTRLIWGPTAKYTPTQHLISDMSEPKTLNFLTLLKTPLGFRAGLWWGVHVDINMLLIPVHIQNKNNTEQ